MTRRLAREDMSFLERRHAQRLGWGPYYAGFAVFVIGHLSWPIAERFETRVALGVILALCLSWIFSRVNGWDRLMYAFMCLATACASVFWLHYRLPSVFVDWRGLIRGWFVWFFWFVVSVHLLGIGWWTSKVKRTEVHLEDDLRGWQEIAKNFGLGMTTRKVSKRDDKGNESGFIVWPRGTTTVSAVMDKREQLEGAMGLPSGSLRLMAHPVGKRNATDRVDYVSFTDDPLTEAIEWPGPQQAPDGGDLSVDVPCLVGYQEDKAPGYAPYYDREINAVINKLFAGSQGSGKSGGLTLHMVDLACRSDGTQWGIDMKDGMEIKPLDRIMDNLACNHSELTEMLEALDAIMTYRGEENTRRSRKAWPVSRTEPLLCVWMDELHRVLAARGDRDHRTMARCEEILVRAATTGRALGISVNGATQNPTLEATRTSQFRDRLQQRICFRTEDARHEGYIIPGRKVDAHLIPSSQPGTCFIQDRDNWTGLPVRYFNVTSAMIEMVLEARAPGLPLDEGSRRAAAAVSPLYAARCAERYGDDFDQGGGVAPVDGPQDPDTGGATVTHIDPEPLPLYPLAANGPDIPLTDLHRLVRTGAAAVRVPTVAAALEARVEQRRASAAPVSELPAGEEAAFALLRARGAMGATAAELAAAADRGNSWSFNSVKRWMEDGRIAQPGGSGTKYVLPEFVTR